MALDAARLYSETLVAVASLHTPPPPLTHPRHFTPHRFLTYHRYHGLDYIDALLQLFIPILILLRSMNKNFK